MAHVRVVHVVCLREVDAKNLVDESLFLGIIEVIIVH